MSRSITKAQSAAPCLSFTSMPTEGLTQQEEEAFWDEVVAWCETRQLFIGGTVDGAVIYSPLEDGLQRNWKALRRMLGERVGLDAIGPSVVYLGDLPSPRLRRACLEAVSQAQRFLGERMLQCADSLAVLASSYANRMTATVIDGKSLDVRWPGKHPMIQLARVDGEPEPLFGRFRTQRMRPGDLAELIPAWPSLRWNRHPPISDLSRAEWWLGVHAACRVALALSISFSKGVEDVGQRQRSGAQARIVNPGHAMELHEGHRPSDVRHRERPTTCGPRVYCARSWTTEKLTRRRGQSRLRISQ